MKDRGVLGGRVGIQETVLLITAADKRAWKNTACFIGKDVESKGMSNVLGEANKAALTFRRLGRERGACITGIVDFVVESEQHEGAGIRLLASVARLPEKLVA